MSTPSPVASITPDQARANAAAATRSPDEFIAEFDLLIGVTSRRGERRIIVTLPRTLANEGHTETVIRTYQARGFVVEQLSVTGHGWNVQIGW
ncbi:hypothetical protein [Stenotrophomonas maltophilia]|uniref:hypothetical protein n=1 Tax=Stenotrophomonas maltophilia TaxID=40324 RepID=UPI0039F6F5F4